MAGAPPGCAPSWKREPTGGNGTPVPRTGLRFPPDRAWGFSGSTPPRAREGLISCLRPGVSSLWTGTPRCEPPGEVPVIAVENEAIAPKLFNFRAPPTVRPGPSERSRTAHGGAAATVLDDPFGFLLYLADAPAVTGQLNVRCNSPVLLGDRRAGRQNGSLGRTASASSRPPGGP